MKIKIKSYAIALACATLASAEQMYVESKPDPVRDALNAATAKLESSLSADKHTYGVGEAICLDFKIRNPTGETLRVFAPFTGRQWGVTVWEKDSEQAKRIGLEYWPTHPDGPASVYSEALNSVMALEAGKTIERRICSPEKTQGKFLGFAPPRRPGRFRFSWRMGKLLNGPIDLDIEAPQEYVPLAHVEVPGTRRTYRTDPGRDTTVYDAVAVFALRAKSGKVYLCRSWPSGATAPDYLKAAKLRSAIEMSWGLDYTIISELPAMPSKCDVRFLDQNTLDIIYEIDGRQERISATTRN